MDLNRNSDGIRAIGSADEIELVESIVGRRLENDLDFLPLLIRLLSEISNLFFVRSFFAEARLVEMRLWEYFLFLFFVFESIEILIIAEVLTLFSSFSNIDVNHKICKRYQLVVKISEIDKCGRRKYRVCYVDSIIRKNQDILNFLLKKKRGLGLNINRFDSHRTYFTKSKKNPVLLYFPLAKISEWTSCFGHHYFLLFIEWDQKTRKKVLKKRNDVPERNLIESQSFLHPGIERSRDNWRYRWMADRILVNSSLLQSL